MARRITTARRIGTKTSCGMPPASALSYETLRFDYAQIVHDWKTVQPAILAALGRVRARI
ncbi:hypothetical protein L2X99_09075 [Microbacterium sp. KUDC0406]|uniref:hypothetical protein n=1 Tax=Microbacterium sp. KUDC0406 TaxID=2909588 RepID=UPI001F408940|nr:hypothetical protein [Microbacterium sp. KUDC0406]UJP11606.1 hypothetical protein L2X99_09075 [Microbacterium sp. KUDC0406]